MASEAETFLKLTSIWFVVSLGMVTGSAYRQDGETLDEHRPYFPAIFAFGDSTVDIGNNNILHSPSPLAANFLPYGIDYIPARGSFTNGKGFLDFFGDYIGLPPVGKHSDFNSTNAASFTSGINFASGGSGVLPETNCFGGLYCTYLTTQVQQFVNASHNYQPKVIAESLVLMSVGSNDYIKFFENSASFNATSYLISIVSGIGEAIQGLYMAGLRKFIIFEVGALGCTPVLMASFGTTECLAAPNGYVAMHNAALKGVLADLRLALPDASILEGLLTGFFTNVTADPSSFGLVNVTSACCGGGVNNGQYWCGSDKATLCEDRDDYLFWDPVHVTQVAWEVVAKNVFNGEPGYVSPVGPKDISAIHHISTQ